MRAGDFTYYRSLWSTMKVLPNFLGSIAQAADAIEANRALYVRAERLFRVPQELFGLTHYRECSCNPDCQILNGQRWDRVTTLVPKGVGPFQNWESAALECTLPYEVGKPWRQGWAQYRVWSVPLILTLLEKHNGGGYMRRGKNSPYLWSGSQHGLNTGKYVADRQYSSTAVDKQIGCAVVWRELIDRGIWSLTTPLESLEEYNAT